jgi:hypothetical protein
VPPLALIVCSIWYRETTRGSNVTEKTCHPVVAVSTLNIARALSPSSALATRARGSWCQAHCFGTSPQTMSVSADTLEGELRSVGAGRLGLITRS